MHDYDQRAAREQSVLKLSIGLTILLAVIAVTTGLVTGSSSIIFDGMYSIVDGVFSIAALAVTRLIYLDANRHRLKAPRFTERFQYGFWHLEPMLLTVNGLSLSIAVFYGLFNAVSTILRGGHSPNFGPAVIFAIFAVVFCFSLAVYEHRLNRQIKSDFLALDAKGWMISGSISLALLLAFVFGLLIKETSYDWMLPYIDPAILAIIALLMAPVPYKIVKSALGDVLMLTPPDLESHVNEVVDAVVARYGFIDSQSYIAKVGRSLMIEIHLILPQDYNMQNVGFIDKVRSEIGDAIGDAGPDRWLTVSFTAQPEWAY